MKRLFITFCMAAILGGLFCISCTKHYTIAVRANNDDWGTVTGGGRFAEGATATITAIPNSNNHFIKWDDGVRDNPRIVIVTANITYTAIFERPESDQVVKVTFKGSEWNTGSINGEITLIDNKTAWRVTAGPVSAYEFPRIDCAAFTTAVGHHTDETTDGYHYHNGIIDFVEYYESDVIPGDDGEIHGDWWAKSVDLHVKAFDPNSLIMSGVVNATMFNAYEAFIEGAGIDNATTTNMIVEINDLTLEPYKSSSKK